MKAKKLVVLLAAGILAASLALVGCSDDSGSQKVDQATDGEYTLLNDGVLVIGTSPDFPPFENIEDGEYVGLDIAIGEAVAERLGLTPEFKTIQFDGIIPAVVSGGQVDVAISGFTVDPDRAKEIDFTDSYFTDDQAIAVLNETEIEGDIDEFLNNENVTIAVQSGTSGETYIQENYPNAVCVPYGPSTDAFAALQSGKATAVCTNAAVVQRMIDSAYPDAHIVKSIATGEDYAMIVSKDNPELTKAINEVLKELKEDGTLESFEAQYL